VTSAGAAGAGGEPFHATHAPLQAPPARLAPRRETAVTSGVVRTETSTDQPASEKTGGGLTEGERVALREHAAAPVGGTACAHLVDTLRCSERRQAQKQREAREGIAVLRQADTLLQGLRGAQAGEGARNAGPLPLGVPQQCYSQSNSVNTQHPRGGRMRLASELKGG
jgi:hypothetical protein